MHICIAISFMVRLFLCGKAHACVKKLFSAGIYSDDFSSSLEPWFAGSSTPFIFQW